MKILKIESYGILPDNYTGEVHYNDGSFKEYYLNGKLHKEDGPARIFSNESFVWFIFGEEYSESEYNLL